MRPDLLGTLGCSSIQSVFPAESLPACSHKQIAQAETQRLLDEEKENEEWLKHQASVAGISARVVRWLVLL